jgi:uncharacterized Zn finger protein
MKIERLREPPGRGTELTTAAKPAECPECHSKALTTLAKTITPETYWRCETCGTVWNQQRRRGIAASRNRW